MWSFAAVGRSMMTLIKYELKKLRGARLTLLVSGLLIVAGLLFIFWRLTAKPEGCSLIQQAQLFHSLETEDPGDMVRRIRDLRDRQADALTSAAGEDRAGAMEKLVLYAYVLRDLETVADYDSTLAALTEGEGSISGLMTGSEYRRRDLEAARQAYGRLTDIKLRPVFSGGIGLLLDQPVLDLILMLAAWCLVLSLFQSEYDGGTLAYIRMTGNGVLPTLAAKLAVLTGLLALCSLALYGGGLAVVCLTTGGLPWDAPVQGVAALVRCPYRIGVGQFLALFFSLKTFSFLVLAWLFAALCVMGRGVVPASAGLGAVFGVEWLLYRYVSPFSPAGVLSRINLMGIWQELSLFSGWGTVDCLDVPVPRWALSLALLAALAVASAIGLIWFFRPPHSCEPRGALFKGGRITRRLSAKSKTRSLFRYEAKKLWRIEHGGALLAVLLVIELFSCARIHRWMGVEDIYYQRYMDMLSGVPSAETDEAVGRIQADFAEKRRLLSLAAARLSGGEITEVEYRALRDLYAVSDEQQAGWERALADYERAAELRARGVDAACVSQDGWELLLGPEGRLEDLRQHLGLTVFLILGLAGYGSMEQASGMTPLLRLYPNRRRIISGKRLHAAGYAALMSLAVFIPRRLAVMDRYGLSLGDWSVQSLRIFDGSALRWPVRTLFALQTAAGIAVAVVCAELLLALSLKLKNRITTLLTGAGIFFVPGWVLLMICTMA